MALTPPGRPQGDRLAHLTLLTRPGPGGAAPVTVWQAVRHPPPRTTTARRFTAADLWQSFACHQAVFWGSLAITLLAAAASSVMQQPMTEAQIRVSVEAPQGAPVTGTIAAAGQELTGARLRLAALDAVGWWRVFPDLRPTDAGGAERAVARLADMQTVWTAEGGEALLVRTRHNDEAVAAALDRALVSALLARQVPPVAKAPPVVTSMTGPPAVLAQLRARVVADLDAADHRAAMLSESLTDTAHDMVQALRATAGQAVDGKPVAADVVDQGRVLLAELQLKRLQLASKYQDDFPAVTALDGEIDRLRSFLAGEQRHVGPARTAANPVLETLTAERRRLAGELDEQNGRRTALRVQLAGLDQQIAAAAHVPVPVGPTAPVVASPTLVADGTSLLSLPDPRLLSVPSILLVGVLGALLLQWVMLRSRQVIATAAEAEMVLGLPVLRCLDVDGHAVGYESQGKATALNHDPFGTRLGPLRAFARGQRP